MKKIPKIIEVERIEDKPDLWKVRLNTEITIFLSTEILYKELVKQTYIPSLRMPIRLSELTPLIKELTKKGQSREQILTKLNYILVKFNALDHMHFCNFDKKSSLFVIVNRNRLDEKDYLVETAIKLDIEGEEVLVSYYQLVEESYLGLRPIIGDKLSDLVNTPWIKINVKLLKIV